MHVVQLIKPVLYRYDFRNILTATMPDTLLATPASTTAAPATTATTSNQASASNVESPGGTPAQATPNATATVTGNTAQAAAASTQTKPTEAAKPAENVETSATPKAYTLTLPEGSDLKTADVEAYANKHGLTNDAAQEHLNSVHAAGVAQVSKLAKQWNEQTTAWQEATKADKEIGGEKLDASLARGKASIERYGTSEFKQFLEQSGLGNHPEMIRYLARVGNAMAEDRTVIQQTPSAQGQQDYASALYGRTTPN